MEPNKPTITPITDGPYLVKSLDRLADQKGAIECKETIALCRCGGSANKPYCDGTHAKIGFSSKKMEDRLEDRKDDYNGKHITIHDNRGICAHAGYCTDGLSSVFRMKEEPWIHPNSEEAKDIIAIIEKCPSGALSYSIDAVQHIDNGGDPSIFIAPNGPYVISGGAILTATESDSESITDHCTLCRCGGSKNKPLCDGSHWDIKFDEEAT